jgi:DNA polymerase I
MSKKAILLDGNSLAYRAFYALPDTMKTTSGITTNAIYGFTTMLIKVLDRKPDYIAVAFDRAAPTFRHKEYKEYKATRQKAPPTLYEQMPYVKSMVVSFGIPVLEMDGFEADDIIGTLAKEAEQKGFDVEIFTGDMDALQLVDNKITVQRTVKGLTDIVAFDEKEVEGKYGITPKQVIDYKAILGDTSDNIPGIHGIGKVGAVNLLKEFGTLDNLLNNVSNIKSASLKKKVEDGIESAKLSRMLATIVTNVPVRMDLDILYKGIDWSKVIPRFEEFEFGTLIKKYAGQYGGATLFTTEQKREEIKASDAEYITVTDNTRLSSLISHLKASKEFAYDTETTSLGSMDTDLVGISISYKTDQAYYIPVGHNNGKQLDIESVISALKPIFEDPSIKKIGQNIKFDNEVLFKYGISVKGVSFDTMVAAYTLDPTSGKYGLKSLAHGLLGKRMIEISELIGTGAKQKSMAEVDIDIASDYACSDADSTYQLKSILAKKINDENLKDLYEKIEVPLIEVLTNIEENGVSVDTKKLGVMSKEIELEIKDLERNIFAISGEVFNLNSPKQLQVILFDKLKLPIIKRTKTGASTDAEVLEELSVNYEIAQKLMDYRQINKLKSTYIDVLPELINKRTGRIHTSFNQTVTATGRLSSTNPNLQNIPVKGIMAQRIRGAFVPAKKGWKILTADYSQIELRVLAHLSGDPVFTKAFKEDLDIHRSTAAEVFDVPLDKVTPEMRDKAKVVNFGIVYGMSDYGLSKSLKIKRTEAAEYINKYFLKHAGIKKFIDDVIAQTKKDGFVTTLLGRKRPIPDINNPNQNLRMFAERVAINTPVQGTAADIIKVAMINVYNKLIKEGYKAKLILQVHDELLIELPEDEIDIVSKMLVYEMENAVKLNVPVKVHAGVGDNWAEAKS